MSKVAARRAKLAELKAAKAAGRKIFDTYQVEQEADLYEEVDENQYKKIVRDRLNQDDFVVDDNGEGYADDGREDWDRVQQYDSDSEDDRVIRGPNGKTDKRKRDEDKAKRDANDRDISEYFMKGRTAPQPKLKAVKTEADDQFLADLLGEVDANIPTPVSRVPKKTTPERRKARALSPARQPAAKKAKVADARLPSPNDYEDNDFIAPMDDDLPPPPTAPEVPMSDADPAPSSPTVKVAERKIAQVKIEPAEDEDEDMMEVAHAATINTASVNLSAARPIKKLVKPDAHPSSANSSPMKPADTIVDSSSWNTLNNKLNVVSSSQSETRGIGKIDHKDAIEEDGSLNFFWTDYTEVNGSLCLFGKVLNKKTKSYVSCFVKVDNVLRKLYFLPRETRQRDGADTDETVGMMDVYTEVDEIMNKMKVKLHKIKACTRKYAFELPNIPREGQYLKLLYPYNSPQIAPETVGETFSHVFGSNTALFEQFVLWKNIKGPCWLKIKDADFGALKNASHAKLEVLVDHPNMVSSISDSDNLDAPPLTLMSVAMRMTFNAKQNKQEILSISARIYENVLLSDTTPAEKLPCRTFTLVRPNGAAFPIGFEKLVQGRKSKGLIKLMKQESEILSFFLAQLDVADPDVILGHQLEGVDYSILLNRLHEKKTPQWSRLGRLRKSTWPASMGKVGGNVFAERQVMAGRLLCDLANDAGKSVMLKCQSWSLTEMVSLYLGGEKRRDVDNDAALKTWATTANGFMDYITHIEADTHYIAALALSTQMLPLTKVLTNLAGNSWARTLTGTRAERNEYILLHEFHRNKYICPDKQTFKGRPKPEDENAEDAADSKKKDKYKGGLVFEPEKGLYDKFVLVMDFNSLYPSIIQEYNICFTTVDRAGLADDEDAVPEVPTEQEQGILPKLIATLVSRRRAVKSNMKDKNATPEQLATWDIKQLALKLTANSMYGCLGYTKSRFYARPLAVLTTFKGREILRSTKDLAESNSLQVIYGDTDSVMINANVDSVADALKVGREFKKAVNERYRLLEIDIDNVFRRILLQAKKKYAAINLVEVPGGRWEEKMEVKGLDMKRREYCALSKEISSRILNDILSGDETEVSIQRIHEYLREISAKMREGTVPVQKYIIFTQLGKGPKEYPNADSMPQVQVALREIARGKNVRKGDVISYVITGDSGSSDSVAKRAYTPQDVMKTDMGLKIDVEWYIGKQIFPPVERLCANITGTSTAQLAEQLGLDIRRYSSNNSSRSGGGSQDLEIHPLESQIPDSIRYRDCARLQLRCRKCKSSNVFEGLLGSSKSITPAGVTCATCLASIPNISIVAQVETAIRRQTAKYYEGWLVCDDPQCGNRTRQMSVKGDRCLGPNGLGKGCLGKMRYEFGERDIYNQLCYFASLWDVEKAKIKVSSGESDLDDEKKLTTAEKEEIKALAMHNAVRFGTIQGVVEKYLDKCGRRWVAMDTLFGKLGFIAS